ncbi:SDR family NAD(P)-dependent oxidoreductase [Antribacter gilvus]|uniref:SDR family NAD(P)-dependent oxidoreductase n=1 Tax=Antribacter gilvus TaxID=2304675 RepID=UPI000F794AF0|nr:SDR family NAD(P)-dependent oxidoreductase [Antribacter gilvus]
MTTAPTTILITGATRGLGREAARRLAALGATVWIGARDLAAGEKVADALRADDPDADVRPVAIDVTDDAAVRSALAVVEASGTGLDVLVNNAGAGEREADVADTLPADFLPVFGVNVLGPVRVTQAFLPLLRRSDRPRLVMVSSGLGSFGVTNDPERFESTLVALVYPSSKAALNMITVMYAKGLPDVRVTAVDPGFTATDLNGHAGHQTVTEGTDAIVTACVGDEVPGTFIDRAGLLPW